MTIIDNQMLWRQFGVAIDSLGDALQSEGQLRVRALDPELVWLTHEHEPWRSRQE